MQCDAIDLTAWDVILVNTSAGKDSQAMMALVAGLARAAGVLDRVVAVHADLGRVEWAGTRELAEAQARHLGVGRFIVVRREKGDLLTQIEARGKWPDSANRYCTSDQKRDQIARVVTALVTERAGALGRRVRVLNCLGFRAEESPARAKREAWAVNRRLTNGKREVIDWLPIHDWTVERVWQVIRESGAPHHPAYDLGMPRLSCVFCVFAPKSALMIAGKANRALLDTYCDLEERMGHTFRKGFRISEVREALDRGEEPGRAASWEM